MKSPALTIWLLFGACIASPALANEMLENAEGESIVILDDTQSNLVASAQLTKLENNTSQNTTYQGWQEKAQEIMINALSLTGIKYKYGGNSPETGFDCSGFVRYVFSQAANLSLPPTARAISQIGKTVKKEELQPGDLVFFNTLKSAFSHVGIYLGDHKFIHAPHAGSTVRVEDMQASYWQKRFNGAQRLDTEADNPAYKQH